MINKKTFIIIFLCLIINFVPKYNAFSQFDSHPELDWFTIETDHFYINYHKGTERTAQKVAKITEEIFGPITSLYKYEPDQKVSFIITDVSDIANGATDFYNNRIGIYTTALDFNLRGTTNWLRNVITHEFVHIVQIQASMKFSRKLPAIYFQLLNYEQEKRPDVLYGYPNVIVSYPISGIGVPAWFAEGTAQYMRQPLYYDYWDPHRDMILRMYVFGNNMLSYNEMGQFSSITTLKAESIYNSGFALTRYISEKYGEDKLLEITEHLGDLTNFSMNTAIEKSLGIDGNQLYDEWKSYLKKDYAEKVKDVKASKIEGEIIEEEGFANYNPKFSPDGKKIAYLSNQNADYEMLALMLYDIETKEKEALTAPIETNFSWSPDGKKIIFAKRNSPRTIHGSTTFDLYEYNLKSENEKRLTKNLRAFSPSYSPGGDSICFIVNKDGSLNLYISNANGKNFKPLTFFQNGEQVYNPKFSKDGEEIVFDYSLNESRKLAAIDIKTGEMEFIINEEKVDARNPAFSNDGEKLYFVSNKTGIYNIYAYDMNTGKTTQITNVLGGAFMPSVDTAGNITYSSYQSTGYKIALLEDFTENDEGSLGAYKQPQRLVQKYANPDSLSAVKKNNFEWDKLKNFDDKKITEYNSKPYKSLFTQIAFFPILRLDNYTKGDDWTFFDAIKPGLYFYSDEVLNRFSIFGGASINKRLERDLFLQFQYQNGFPIFKDFFNKTLHFNPVFTLEGYNITRKSTGELIASVDTLDVDVEYDLLEFDFGMAFKLINRSHNFKFTYTFSKYASSIDDFLIPQSGIQVSASSQDYFRANDFSLAYHYRSLYPNRNWDIIPIGREVNIKYNYEISNINPELEVKDDGTVVDRFSTNRLHKLDADLTESFGLFNNKHSLSFKLRGAIIFGPPVDDFYNFYAAGLPGMKGYTFYALGGGRVATLNLTYRFPLLTNIDTRISPLYLDKLYLSIYGDYGNAWEGNDVKLNDFKKDIGAQLRLKAFSFYVFPTSIFFDAAYGFDSYTRTFLDKEVTYGKEWRFYFGMLFGFDI